MADLPPSYNEVINTPPVQKVQPSMTPSAPRLDAIVTNPDLGNTQGQSSQRVCSSYPHAYHNDGRFSAWDDTATEMLIMNRLGLNERFERAQNQQERDELWNIILNHLLAARYTFARIDLIQYWEYQFYIYKSIVNSLTARTQTDSSWKYFEPMDSVFKYSTEASKSKSLGEGDYAPVVSSLATNTFGGLTNLRSISDTLSCEPIAYKDVHSEPVISSQPNPVSNIPAENSVVTMQPSTLAHQYVPIVPNTNRDDDDYCCCCIGCCNDKPSGYSSRTGGYTSHSENYNTFTQTDGYTDYTNDYTGDYTADNNYCQTSDPANDNNYCHTSDYTNDENRGDGCCDTSGVDYGGCDSGGGGTDDGCCDCGGTDD